MKTTNFPGRVEKRQKEAQERREEWSKLTPQEQLAALDARLGKGEGAKKQRERLVKLASTVVKKAQSLVEAKNAKLTPSEEKIERKMKAKERRQHNKADSRMPNGGKVKVS